MGIHKKLSLLRRENEIMKGITSIFDHKKWVFAYVVLGLGFWQLEGAQLAALLGILIPCVIGASSFDKSPYNAQDNK